MSLLYSTEIVYRPPEESRSVLLEVSTGCSYSACTFCHYSIDKMPVSLLSDEEIISRVLYLSELYADRHRVFFLGGNVLALGVNTLVKIFTMINKLMPQITEIALYGRADDVLRKGRETLSAFLSMGLHTIYIGVESGDNEVLKLINKGLSKDITLEALSLLQQVGIQYGLSVINGLGGAEFSFQHAVHTAELLSQTRPRSMRVFTLVVEDGAPIQKQIAMGDIALCNDLQLLEEMAVFAENLNMSGGEFAIIADHIQADLKFAALLPQGKSTLVSIIRGEAQKLRQQLPVDVRTKAASQ